MLAQVVMFLASQVAMPAWLLQLLLTLAPQLEAQIPKAELEKFAVKLLQDIGKVLGRGAEELWKEFCEYVRTHPPQPSGPPDYAGNEPAPIDWSGKSPPAETRPEPDEKPVGEPQP